MIISNTWGLTAAEQVDYWSDALADARAHGERDAENQAACRLRIWEALRSAFGSDHVIADLSDVTIPETEN